jgi:hypothetical protein
MNTLSKIISTGILLAFLTSSQNVYAETSIEDTTKDLFEVGAAMYLQGMLHEIGHTVIAYQLNAESSKMDFFTTQNGNFFLGLNTVSGIQEKSWVSYRMGGFVFSNMTYELALDSYRRNPNKFSKTLALMSATDFFRYSVFAFALGNENVDEYDPAYVGKKTGFGKEAIILSSLAQTLLNVYRLYSEDDTVIPFISFSGNQVSNSVQFGFTVKLP